jgi:hypothetical protein
MVLAAALTAAPGLLHAQFDFKIADRMVQVHSFASQGFAYSNGNNWLTMKTTSGSFNFIDVGANASVQITDRFRVGVQFYARDVGQLGKWHPSVDWAQADYRFHDWFGVRVGKVKTVFGLFNDVQDNDSLHTFALLPQSIYPTDLRDSTIAHLGGDVYGSVSLKGFGSFSYTGFVGQRRDSLYGGYPYLLQSVGIYLTGYTGLQYGGDLKWNTPLKELLVGASHMDEDPTGIGTFNANYVHLPGGTSVPYQETSIKTQTSQFYGQYSIGNLQVNAEYRRNWSDKKIYNGIFEMATDNRAWYVSGAYRICRHLELGSYYSRSVTGYLTTIPIPKDPGQSAPNRHVYDKVVSARVDLTSFWSLKFEGHFMDGNGSRFYPNGFYENNNSAGFQPNTNALVIRTGLTF